MKRRATNPARWTGIILAILFLARAMIFAEDASDVRQLVQEALRAHGEKNYALFTKKMETAFKLRSGGQYYRYNLAAGYALTGKKDKALSLLSEAATMGLAYPALEKDEDFNSLRGSPEYGAILKKLAENQKPMGRSETAFVVEEKGLVPEGLAFDPATKTFYLGSVYRRKIIAIDQTGTARDFSSEIDGLWSVMGMKVDPVRRSLWVCTAGHLQMANASSDDDGKSGIFRYDLITGKLAKKYLIPMNGEKHWLGDLTLDAHGNVYASDSLLPAIYVISRDKGEIESWRAGAPFMNPQGLAVTSDQRHLLMADYLKGLFLIDLRSKEVEEIAAPPDVTLLGIDGIYDSAGGIVAVQNGIIPNRVVRIKMSDDYRHVEKLEVLAANHPAFDEPTLGVVDGRDFYFNANSQWGAIDPKGQLAPADKLHPAIVLKLKL